MKTWMILKVLGEILGTVGPLPYDVTECQNRIVMFNTKLDEAFKDATKVSELRKTWPKLERTDLGFVCVESAERPKITN